jgi:ligand-binding sensor domain-containing protein/signal transduction histidine kinase
MPHLLKLVLVLCLALVGLAEPCAQAGQATQAGQASQGNAAQGKSRWWEISDRVFQHLPLDDGSRITAITTLAQDAQGFLWIGTQSGLLRWDGYRYRTYTHHPDDPNSVPDSHIQALYLDRQGRLWVGTNGHLAWYDGATDQFVLITIPPNSTNTPPGIYAMEDDGQQGLWLLSENGLGHLPRGKNQIVPMRANKDNPAMPPEGGFSRMVLDRQGGLWLAGNAGLAYRNPKTGHFNKPNLPGLPGPKLTISGIGSDNNGLIWLGTDKKGVFVLNPASFSVETVPDHGIGFDKDFISNIIEVTPGQFWLSTDHGLIVLDRASMHTRRILNDPMQAYGLPDNSIDAMLRDRSGLIWLANPNGISRHNPMQAAIHSLHTSNLSANHPLDPLIQSMRAMPDGSIWLGLSEKGVQVIDPTRQTLRLLPGPATAPASASGQTDKNTVSNWPIANISVISQPIHGSVYLVGQSSLLKSDLSGSQITALNIFKDTEQAGITALLTDGDRLWLGTGNGLRYYDTTSPGAMAQPVGPKELSQETVSALERDRQGRIWIGTPNNGLFLFEPASKKVQHILANANTGLASRAITSLLYDSRGQMWVGTLGNGISLYRPQRSGSTIRFQTIDGANGLPQDLVNHILEDRQGRIWAATDAGFARIEPDTLAVQALRRIDGVTLKSYLTNSGGKTLQGELLFGGTGGITIIEPERWQGWQYPAPVMITQIKVGNKVLNATCFNQPQCAQTPLAISPDGNSLTVEFAALDLSSPERNQYRYRLDGYDPDWISSDAGKRQAAYTNLPPGEYQLHLGGSNRNGEWRELATPLPIRVLPAWYQTWWFRLILLLSLLLAVWLLVQIRTRYLRGRQLDLEHQVEQRTLQLQQAQEQLVRQEKLAALGGMVRGMAHEINTPLGTTLVALTGISGIWQQLVQALHDGSLSKPMLESSVKDGSEYAELALSTANRAADLVNIFKTVVVPEGSTRDGELDLAHYLPEIAALVESRLTQGGSQLIIDVPPGMIISVAQETLSAALTRILTNVPDHGFADGRHGTLRISARAEPDGAVLIEIHDDGHGIAADDLHRVFDPFFTTKCGAQGHIGLGLHIAYNHVTLGLHGSLQISSVPGSGTTVTLRLRAGTLV